MADPIAAGWAIVRRPSAAMVKKSFGGSPLSFPGTWDLPVLTADCAGYTPVRQARETTTGLRAKVADKARERRSSTSGGETSQK